MVRDERYQKTERRLVKSLEGILFRGRRAEVMEVCRGAGVVKSTFYRHYHTVRGLICAREGMVLGKLRQARVRTVDDLAVFTYMNRDDMELAILTDDVEFEREVLEVARPALTVGWPHYGKAADDYLFSLFEYEVMGELRMWGMAERFSRAELTRHAQNLTYLSQTAAQRFAPLMRTYLERERELARGVRGGAKNRKK